MRIVRAFSGLLGAAFVVFAAASAAQAQTLTIGPSARVCQLTGQTDWATGAPTDAQTISRDGLIGIDLGFPVEADSGKLYFLFGDADPPNHPPNTLPGVPPDDAMGVTTRTQAPDKTTCLDMTLLGGGRRSFGHPVVTPKITQGSYNVPTGGAFVNDLIYGFFWAGHCAVSDPYGPNPTTPLVLPAAGPSCIETAASNSLGHSVLAYAQPSAPLQFTQVAGTPSITYLPGSPMPKGFNYVTAGDPMPRRRGVDYKGGYETPIPVFGVSRYRMSIPYLAMAPRATFGDVKTWTFYAGVDSMGGPQWISYAQWQAGQGGANWTPPGGAELWANSPNSYSLSGDERCVGEHQASWNPDLGVWLMLYTCGGWQVEARTAAEPWGPWSKPKQLLSAVNTPGLFCTLFWNKVVGLNTCPGKVSQQVAGLSFGYFYAPFVMSRYTEPLPAPSPGARSETIYWMLSTWDPYQVTVMQSTLTVTP
jgi:hypothetical protein